MKLDVYLEKFGSFLGKKIYKSFLKKWIEKKINKFDIKISGIENLKNLNNQSFILASNHLCPLDKGLLKTGISSDSFVISKIITQETGQEVSFATNYLIGMHALGKVLEWFTKGFIVGVGSIPVGKGHDDFHNIFLKTVEKTVLEKRPILIFPTGDRYYDFEEAHEIKAGAGYIALKYNLPIIPVYIKGAYEWEKPGQRVDLLFGSPIMTKGLIIDQISAKIKEEILKLKKNYLLEYN